MIQLFLSSALQVTESPHGLTLHYNYQSFPLAQGRAESILINTFLHIRAKVAPARICEHLRYHQSPSTLDTHCPCCKLEGRILSGMGRKSLTTPTTQMPARPHGTVQVRHLKSGLTGAQIAALDRAAVLKRESAAAKAKSSTTPQLKSTPLRIEDLI